MLKVSIFFAIIIALSHCKSKTNKESKIESLSENININQLWEETQTVAGANNRLDQRALGYLYIYTQTDQNLNYAYLKAQSTLALERLIQNRPILTIIDKVFPKNLQKHLDFWADQLSIINKTLFVHIYLAYRLSSKLSNLDQWNILKKNILNNRNYNSDLQRTINQLDRPIKIFLKLTKEKLSNRTQHAYFTLLSNWEHLVVKEKNDKCIISKIS